MTSSPASAHCAPVNSHWPERMYRSAKMSNPWPDAAHIAPNTDMTANATSSATPAARLDGLTVRPRSATLLVWSFGSTSTAIPSPALRRARPGSRRPCAAPFADVRNRGLPAASAVEQSMVADAGFEAAVPVAPSVGVAQVVGQRVLDGLLPCLGRRGDEPVDVAPVFLHVANSPRMSIPPRTWRDGARGRGGPPSCRPPSPPFPRHRGTSSWTLLPGRGWVSDGEDPARCSASAARSLRRW